MNMVRRWNLYFVTLGGLCLVLAALLSLLGLSGHSIRSEGAKIGPMSADHLLVGGALSLATGVVCLLAGVRRRTRG